MISYLTAVKALMASRGKVRKPRFARERERELRVISIAPVIA
jgi:hypothetical protein